MSPFSEFEERYRNDVQFKALIDVMIHQAESLQMSPGELRMAAIFAEWKIQLMRPPGPIYMTIDEARERGLLIVDDPIQRK